MPKKDYPVGEGLDTSGRRKQPAAPQVKQEYDHRIAELEAWVAALEAALFGHSPTADYFAKPYFTESASPEPRARRAPSRASRKESLR